MYNSITNPATPSIKLTKLPFKKLNLLNSPQFDSSFSNCPNQVNLLHSFLCLKKML